MNPHIINLYKRIDELEKSFLPAERSKTGEYTAVQYDHASAFCLMAHAEIEFCLENLLIGLVQSKFKKIRSGDYSDLEHIWNLIRWYSFYSPASDSIERTRKIFRQFSQKHFLDVVNECNQHYINHVKQNHGIALDNLHSLLSPLGIDPQEINASWCLSMNSFKGIRGDRAHRHVRAYKPVDPFDAKQLVQELVQGLAELEQVLYA